MSQQGPAQGPAVDGSRRFLNLSAGALLALIAGGILACCVLPIVLCLFTPILGAFSEIGKKDPTVAITSCVIEPGESMSSAKVGFRITNNDRTDESFMVKFEIRDSSGARVGSGAEWVFELAPGGSVNDEADVAGIADGGKTCHIVGVER